MSTGGPSYGNAPLSQNQAPTYWNGTGTVSTTITAMDDLEYGHCNSDADRVLTLAPGTDANGREKLMLKDAKASPDLKEAAVTIESRTESSSSSSPSR